MEFKETNISDRTMEYHGDGIRKRKIITETRRHLRCLTATLAQEELSGRRIHSM